MCRADLLTLFFGTSEGPRSSTGFQSARLTLTRWQRWLPTSWEQALRWNAWQIVLTRWLKTKYLSPDGPLADRREGSTTQVSLSHTQQRWMICLQFSLLRRNLSSLQISMSSSSFSSLFPRMIKSTQNNRNHICLIFKIYVMLWIFNLGHAWCWVLRWQ